jgi:hypothetical protein
VFTNNEITGTGPAPYVVNGQLQYQTVSSGTAASWGVLFDITPFLEEGKTLTSVGVALLPAAGHAALPNRKISAGVFLRDISNAGLISMNSLGDFTIDPAGNVAAYQLLHTLTVPCDQFNVVDHANYGAVVQVWDESGTNALAGGFVLALTLNFT